MLAEQGVSHSIFKVGKPSGAYAIAQRRWIPTLVSVGNDKHLLVDGSNILHAWPEMRALLARDRDVARQRLLQELSVIHDAEGIRLTIVFDGRGDEISVEFPRGGKTCAVVYTPAGVTADDVIEQWVGKAVDPANCLVATDDRAERSTVEATGAASLSAKELLSWRDRAQASQARQLAGLQRNNDTSWRRKDN